MVPRPQVNMRLDDRTDRLLKRLQLKLNLNSSAVVRLAIARLADLEGVSADDADEGKAAA